MVHGAVSQNGGSVRLAVSALRVWHRPGAAYLLAGSLLYLLGPAGKTVTVTSGNVSFFDNSGDGRPRSS